TTPVSSRPTRRPKCPHVVSSITSCRLRDVGTFRGLARHPHWGLMRGRTQFATEEGHNMQEKYTYGLWGAAVGAIALAVVGFSWGGWSTSGGTTKQVQAAVLTA